MRNSLDWTVKDLEDWAKKIENKAKELGLDFFEQIFEICSHHDMIGYMAYLGMTASYPHWAFGKSFEITETLYRYRVRGLPYEMVINSSPSLAYLMRDNALPMQLLTMAHVYGHNDFMKNNINFSHTRPELVLERIKVRADRVRSYIEDPSIGPEKVENLLDIARALAHQRSHNFQIKKLSRQEQKKRLIERYEKPKDKSELPDLNRVPLEPESDILLFIRDHNPFLEDWEKDILTIIDEEAQYFIPQIETKIMNEGWATYWHYKILNSLDLPDAIYLGFIKEHNQVVTRPKKPASFITPYYLGFKLWQDIEKRWEEKDGSGGGLKRMFFSREVDRDSSFLRQYLTQEFLAEMDIFQHEKERGDRVVTKISDEDDWKEIRELLIKDVGASTIPVIKIWDANFRVPRGLFLRHEYDGRELYQEYTVRTIEYLQKLWRGTVCLETIENNQKVLYKCTANKIKRITPSKEGQLEITIED